MQEESGNGTKGAIAGSIGTCLCAVRAGVAGEAERERAVTAYASIPSVRDLSGQRIWIEEIYPLAKDANFAEHFIRTCSDWKTPWMNDRIYPWRPFIYAPRASQIDS